MSAIPERYRVDPGPMREWLTERMYSFQLNERAVSSDALGAHATFTPHQRLLRLLGWDHEGNGTGERRLYRWLNEADVIDRRDVEEALHTAGVDWFDVYPAPEDARPDEDDVDEEFCFACRAFVTPIGGCCAWCDRPVMRVDLRNLPPRPVETAPPEASPLMRVSHVPRVKKGRPFYLDVDLVRRRRALEVFAETASIERAADAIWAGRYSSLDSAYRAIRSLLVREGWYEPTGARGPHAHPELRDAAPRVREALEGGTWGRVLDEVPSPSQRRVFDERLLRDAAFMYFVDESSFNETAERLLPRSSAASVYGLKSALIDEWNRRGWPRRTFKSSSSWTRPAGGKRCRARTEAGGRCKRYAQSGKTRCFDHDPERADEQRQRNAHASKVAYIDGVPVEPFAYWLRLRACEVGSVKALHRRVEDAISYDSLSRWTTVWGEVGSGRSKVVRRSTVDRILAAWGDGTTFEDVYMPVESDDAALVPEAIAS